MSRSKFWEMEVGTENCKTVYGVPCGFESGDDCENCRLIYEGECEEVEYEFHKLFPGYDIFDVWESGYTNDNHKRTRTICVQARKSL